MNEEIVRYYQTGHGLPVFTGAMRYGQTGAGFFGALLKMALPLLGTIGRSLFNIAGDTATQVIEKDKPVGEAIVNSAVKEIASKVTTRKRKSDFSKIHKQRTVKQRRR